VKQITTSDLDNALRFSRAEIAGLREQALNAIEKIKWIPEWGKNRIQGAVLTRPDWCISRQRTWGVPIPFFYDKNANPVPNPISQKELAAEVVRNAANLINEHGSNIWFEKSAVELWSLVKPKDWKGAEAVVKSNDTLDVWIDSGSSSSSTQHATRNTIHGKPTFTSKAATNIAAGFNHPCCFRSLETMRHHSKRF